eukprot:TRINITY_DN38458_c0_g1_i1.p1 TRINITY_DN38458_c0_g1~~TRINITY_DN38458_c0_g1_i1.p1  ORF type:complete len:903 (-),score=222.42 TRINITY_DN38458_c0_g1_i1:144-2489(-)
MLAYRRCESAAAGADGAGSSAYVEDCAPSDSDAARALLPAWAREQVERRSAEMEKEAADEDRRADEQVTLRMLRDSTVRGISERLSAASGLAPSELSVLPTAWLERWMRGTETVDHQLGGPTRVDYSALLLPKLHAPSSASASASASGEDAAEAPAARPLLDPFALWDERGKVLPTQILQEDILSRELPASLVPPGLSLEDVRLAKLLSPEVCRLTQRLVCCQRELLQLTSRLYYQDVRSPEEAGCVIWRSALYKFSQRLGRVPMQQPRRGKAKEIKDEEIWADLRRERARGRPLRIQTALATGAKVSPTLSSGAGGVISATGFGLAAAIDLGSDLACPHGLLRHGPKVGFASQQDVDRLQELDRERSQLWAGLGLDVPLGIKADGLLQWPCKLCDACKAQKHDQKLQKSAETKRREDERRSFKTLASGGGSGGVCPAAGSVVREAVERFVLIPGDWRRRWVAFVTSTAGPPGQLDFSSLRCEHGKLRYDPALHCYQAAGSASSSSRQHAQAAAYCLVPIREAESICRVYGAQSDGSRDWCVLTRSTVPPDSNVQTVDAEFIYEADPEPCRECAISAPLRGLPVRLVDMRSGTSAVSNHFIEACGVSPTGLELKRLILAASGLQGVGAGHVLLFVERPGRKQVSIGDFDSLDGPSSSAGGAGGAASASSQSARGRMNSGRSSVGGGGGVARGAADAAPPSLLAEVHAMDLSGVVGDDAESGAGAAAAGGEKPPGVSDGDEAASPPPAKRQRSARPSSLLSSRLSGAGVVAAPAVQEAPCAE